MGERKPFVAVHQTNVEEFDSLEDALLGMDTTRRDYHRGGYRHYDFEGGVYQKVGEEAPPIKRLPNQEEYEGRYDAELKPFAVVDRADNSQLIGTTITIDGIGTMVLTKDNLPELAYHGFDEISQARAEFEKRRENDAGLYFLVAFQKVPGPDKGKPFNFTP